MRQDVHGRGENGGERGVGEQRVDGGVQEVAQPRVGIVAGQRPLGLREQRLEPGGGDGLDQRLRGGEVAVDRSHPDRGGPRDVVELDRRPLVHESAAHLDDAVPVAGGVLAQRGGGHGHQHNRMAHPFVLR